MKSVKILSIMAILGMTAISSPGQIAKELSFAETTHDFGIINEVDGPVETEFVFTNTGTEPIKIENVRASCGCTTPGWSKEEIAGGDSGFIKARYNPTNRPGPFKKSLTITSSGQSKTYVLYIKGTVNPRPRTIVDDFPTLMGGIRAKNRAFVMGKVQNNQPAVRSYEIYNASKDPITFLDSMQGPAYIAIKVEPKTVQPEQRATITVTYDVKSKNALGQMNDNIILFTDEKENPKKQFSVYLNVEEYFPPMTPEELAQAPRLVFDKALQDLGKIAQTDVVSTDFVFKNTGKTALNIRKIDSSCGCTVAASEKMDILPGEESKITVTFNPQGRRGQQQKSITIFSNDPKAPTQRVIIKAYIEQ